MKLPQSLRDYFKAPFGKLIIDSQTSKENILKEIPPDSLLITVGDATSEKIMNFGLIPSIQIVDGKEKRIKRNIPTIPKSITIMNCDNSPGMINPKCIDVIKSALNSKYPVRIEVNGEEDLLVLPVCIYAPDGTIVMYGQPNEGLVIISVTSKIRNKTKLLFDLMK